MGNRTAFYYDHRRNLTCVLDPENGQTHYTDDKVSRMTSVKNPWGETAYYEYSPGGKLLARTLGNGCVTSYDYDWHPCYTPELVNGIGARSYAGAAAGDMTYDGAMKAAAAQGAGNWVLDLVGNTLTLKNVDGSTFCVFAIDDVSAPTTRTRS